MPGAHRASRRTHAASWAPQPHTAAGRHSLAMRRDRCGTTLAQQRAQRLAHLLLLLLPGRPTPRRRMPRHQGQRTRLRCQGATTAHPCLGSCRPSPLQFRSWPPRACMRPTSRRHCRRLRQLLRQPSHRRTRCMRLTLPLRPLPLVRFLRACRWVLATARLRTGIRPPRTPPTRPAPAATTRTRVSPLRPPQRSTCPRLRPLRLPVARRRRHLRCTHLTQCLPAAQWERPTVVTAAVLLRLRRYRRLAGLRLVSRHLGWLHLACRLRQHQVPHACDNQHARNSLACCVVAPHCHWCVAQ